MKIQKAAGLLGLFFMLAASPAGGPIAVGEVRTWMYQFQEMESAAAVRALGKSSYDLLVVEPVGTYRSARPATMTALVPQLREARPDRLVLAYLDIAEADSHRAYWEPDWKAPSENRPGTPDFLVGPDPDGWKDTYLVAYWDPRWQKLLRADLRSILAAGFDGLCLDWAGAYRDPSLVALAEKSQVNAVRTMVDLLELLRQDATAINPKAVILLQNEAGLLEQDPRVPALMDAVLFEGTWYSGKAEVSWSDARGGDRESPRDVTENRLAAIGRWQAKGKPVLTLDYCLKTEHAKDVYERSKTKGCVPLVSRTALDRLTETPPPGLH